jgi:hypothetical protein
VWPSGTGFSWERVRRHAANLVLCIPASSRLKPVPLNTAYTQGIGPRRIPCGTGFSRERVRYLAANLVLCILAYSSLLKPVPLNTAYTQGIDRAAYPVGPALAVNASGLTLRILCCAYRPLPG